MKEHHPGKKNHRSFVRKKEVITKLTKLTALLVNLFFYTKWHSLKKWLDELMLKKTDLFIC